MSAQDFVQAPPEVQASLVVEAICRRAERARGNVYSFTVAHLARYIYGGENVPAAHMVVAYWLTYISKVLDVNIIVRRAGCRTCSNKKVYMVDTKLARDVCSNPEAFAKKVAAMEGP